MSDVQVIISPQPTATVALAIGAPGLTGQQGAQGIKGDTGATGAQGPAGSAASVTSANITSALGYTPDSPTASRTPTSHTHPLSQITQSSATSGQVATWNGSAWVASTPASSSFSGNSDAVPEGSTNLYFTTARAVSALTSTLSSYATTSALNTAISGLSSVYTTTTAVASQIAAYGYQTAAQVSSAITSALTWANISGKPSTFSPSAHASTHASGGSDPITIASSQITGLSTVATSGAYSDLTGKPTITTFDQSLNTTDSVQFNQINTPAVGATQLCWGDANVGTSSFLNTDGSIQFYDNGSLSNGLPVNTLTASLNNLWFYRSSSSRYKVMLAGMASTNDLTDSTVICFKGQNNNFTIGQTISPAANTSALTASYSVTGANTTPLLNLSGTWNTSGIARGIFVNITDTASNTGSLLADFQTGGTSRFAIRKDGAITAAGQFAASFSYYNGALITAPLKVQNAAAQQAILETDAANTLAQRNGTNAQLFRIYNTYTDASNYERAFMRWNSNQLEIGTEALGTGANRALVLYWNGSNRLAISTAGMSVQGNTPFRITSGSVLRLEAPAVPASATATGTTGDIQWDANYIYVCTATSTWKRAALATW